MALFLDTDGKISFITPKKDTFSLDELYAHLQCTMIQTINVDYDTIMIIDEEGKLKEDPKFNFIGTFLLHANHGISSDQIIGHAILADSRTEFK